MYIFVNYVTGTQCAVENRSGARALYKKRDREKVRRGKMKKKALAESESVKLACMPNRSKSIYIYIYTRNQSSRAKREFVEKSRGMERIYSARIKSGSIERTKYIFVFFVFSHPGPLTASYMRARKKTLTNCSLRARISRWRN